MPPKDWLQVCLTMPARHEVRVMWERFLRDRQDRTLWLAVGWHLAITSYPNFMDYTSVINCIIPQSTSLSVVASSRAVHLSASADEDLHLYSVAFTTSISENPNLFCLGC